MTELYLQFGAHSRYYPGEWSNNTCRLHLEKSPPDERRHSFDEVCARHSPSLRFFFLERFGACMESWHIAKMNFTRSVAVSSIVGHILGIGDSDLRKILITQRSDEVVHIDFGFVFEQGKVSSKPTFLSWCLCVQTNILLCFSFYQFPSLFHFVWQGTWLMGWALVELKDSS